MKATAPFSRPRPLAAALLVLATIGCSREDPPAPAPEIPTIQGQDGREYVLLARGPHEPIWAEDGHLVRIEYDRNGDSRPDQIAHHDGERLPRLVEDDDDFDGRTDRWIEYDTAGRLERVGLARGGRDAPDTWVFLDAQGNPRRREYDDDGDGDVERAEVLAGGRVVQVEVDANGDGRIDRWQTFDGDRLSTEALDTDADGKPDRRLLYDSRGRVKGLEPIS